MTEKKAEFYKKPSFIAAAIIVLSFFLSYVSAGDSDFLKLKISGLQFVTESASISGDGFDDMKERAKKSERRKERFDKEIKQMKEGIHEKAFNIIDKMSILLFFGAGLLLFGAFKESKGEQFFLDAEKTRYLKIGLLVIAAFLWLRYQFGLGMEDADKLNAGFGIWLTLLAAIFLMFEDKIMEVVNKQMANKKA